MKLSFSGLALVIGVALIGASGAKASTVTDVISFSDIGTYGVTHAGWNGTAVVSGSFDITFDPTKLYLDQSLSGVVSNLTYSVTDNRFSPASLVLNQINSFSYAYGTLDLFSGPANQYGGASKNLTGTPNIVIGINGWTNPNAASDAWYSQTGFRDTLTTSGSVAISPVPLPAALPMFAAVIAVLGVFGIRRRRKAE